MQTPEVIRWGKDNGEGMVVYYQTGNGTDVYGLAVPNLWGGEGWDLGPTWCYLVLGQKNVLIDTGRFGNFDVFKDPSSANEVPWNIPCARLEGGMYTNPDNKPNASCTEGPPLEGSVEITNRRFIVDLDMGTVVGLANFGDENGWPDSHIFRLEGGKVRYVHTLTVCPDGCELPPPKENP